MRKEYEKPAVAVEEYRLTQTIAGCDTIKVGFKSSDCVKNDTDLPVTVRDLAFEGDFIEGDCVESALQMDGDDGICYHTSANMAFTS